MSGMNSVIRSAAFVPWPPSARLSCLVMFVAMLGGVVTTPVVAEEVAIGAEGSRVYHTHPQECTHAKRISVANRVRFKSIEEAEKAGRRLCKRCAALDEAGNDEPSPPKGSRPKQQPPDDQPPDAGGQGGASPAPDALVDLPQIAQVTDVLPGGTIVLDIGEKARLLGAACPRPGQACAEDAVRFIREQTQGRNVRMAMSGVPGPIRQRDALGRLLVYITPEPDGRDLGGELVFQGYAWLDRQTRFDRRGEYVRREDEAWRGARGIWKPLKGSAGKRKVVTGRHAHYYHDRKCPHVAHLTSEITVTVNEAKSRRLPPCPRYGVTDVGRGKRKSKDKEGDANGEKNKE